MMEVKTSETSVNFYQAARHSNPEQRYLHTRRREITPHENIFNFSLHRSLFVVYLTNSSVAESSWYISYKASLNDQ